MEKTDTEIKARLVVTQHFLSFRNGMSNTAYSKSGEMTTV